MTDVIGGDLDGSGTDEGTQYYLFISMVNV